MRPVLLRTLGIASLPLALVPRAASATKIEPLAVDLHRHVAVRRAPPPAGTAAAAPGESGPPSWVSLGPFGGTVLAVAASPAVPGLLLAAVDPVHFATPFLFRSTDAGETWQPVTTMVAFDAHDVEFAADGTAYVATSNDLRRSLDGGLTWSTISNPFFSGVLEVELEHATGALWLGLRSTLAETPLVIRSPDGGTSWADRSPSLPTPLDCTTLAIEPGSPATVYAGFSGSPGGGALWVSPDGGMTWFDRTAGLPAAPIHEIVHDGARAVVAGGAHFESQVFGLYASDDDGVRWTPLHDGSWPSFYTFGLDFDPNDPAILLVATSAGIFRSDDGGEEWTFGVAGTAGISFNTVRFAPNSSTAVFAGASSLGVFRSADGGVGFTASSTGIYALNVVSVAALATNSQRIAAGFAGPNDGGVFSSEDGGVTWVWEAVPPTRYRWVGFAPDGTLYAISDGPSTVAPEGVYRRNGDGTWTSLGPDQGPLFETGGVALGFSADNPLLILLVGNDFGVAGSEATIWRSLSAGLGWTKVYEAATTGSVTAVEILADGTDQTMVAAYRGFDFNAGGALRSVNGGTSWSPSSTGLPADVQGHGLCASPVDPLRLVYAASANDIPFTTTNGGESWTSAGPNFGDFRSITCDGLEDGVIYVADLWEYDVRRSPDFGLSFEPFGAFLLEAIPYQVAWAKNPSQLYLASSTGVWRRDLPALFVDGFDSGDASAWSSSTGGP